MKFGTEGADAQARPRQWWDVAAETVPQTEDSSDAEATSMMMNGTGRGAHPRARVGAR